LKSRPVNSAEHFDRDSTSPTPLNYKIPYEVKVMRGLFLLVFRLASLRFLSCSFDHGKRRCDDHGSINKRLNVAPAASADASSIQCVEGARTTNNDHFFIDLQLS
jgi:hypothetical protein